MSEKKMINEIGDTAEGQFMLGRLQGRQNQRARGEQTTGRIKQTTRRADDYWKGTNFSDGEDFEDSHSWMERYDDYDQYGDFDSDAYRRNQEEIEQDRERQWELHSRVQNKLNKKVKNESKNMNKKNTIRITESQLKRVISESVKKVLKEGIKAADAMNTVSRETAQECGFKKEYDGIDGGFELWGGPLPEDPMERKALLNRLGITRFTSENYMNHTCRITVDPSGKIANIGKKGGHPLLMKLAEFLKQNKISSDKAVKILVSKGFDENKARTWVAKYTPKYEE